MTTPLTSIAPEGPVRGGVVVIQEAFGVTEHIVDVCRRFAAAGYHAVAPHLFHRSGDPVLDYDDLQAAMPLMGALTAADIDEDVDGAVAALSAASIAPRNTAVVGFCMGGTVAFHTATRLDLGAAVSFYGGGIAKGRFGYPSQLDVAGRLATPWLGLFGDRDKGIPPEDVEELRGAVAGARVDTEIVRYPAAEHGFHCDDRPAVYNEAAARDGWARTLQWCDAHFDATAGSS
ncbi:MULTISPECIES: dienelactone hydrolase family protein [unclassified Rhodococcus (in: high G+C Gram-positive bacteria)]|uniref:dienelactone hydrolase family protein n=1 Tax=unclassified Rhodococcus (in: high G+C Gram-positive bacteria) TaxID=192944 RepID=UPI00163A35A5|nr:MULTISPECIES: dienelactone hydrolase family protein [unclassified Rhodococcus (in: high G+C Gram-positive bacteria)]MBC2641132.1 dienelactone hydrolase family protein [Rhodococcus sp. 3A]MBC2894123.1 dienelactone hydrolase family protein [Rhodococcus sp. 4CII]